MVFRRDQRPEYQRQMGALRQQLGATDQNPGATPAPDFDADAGAGDAYEPTAYPSSGRSVYAPAPRSAETSYGFGAAPASAAPTPPALPSLPHADDATTIVSADTALKGDIESRGALHVFGRVEGSLSAVGEIYIAEGADVDANVNAATVVVGGRLRGEVTSSGRFELLPTGRVEGSVSSATLVVHDGGSITGTFRMRGAEAANDARVTSVTARRSSRGTA